MFKPSLTVSLLLPLLIGCATPRNTHSSVETARSACPMASKEYWEISDEPHQAAEMLAIANPDMSARMSTVEIKIFWFSRVGDNNRFILCRAVIPKPGADYARGCGTVSWEFVKESIGNRWKLVEGGEKIIFCG